MNEWWWTSTIYTPISSSSPYTMTNDHHTLTIGMVTIRTNIWYGYYHHIQWSTSSYSNHHHHHHPPFFLRKALCDQLRKLVTAHGGLAPGAGRLTTHGGWLRKVGVWTIGKLHRTGEWDAGIHGLWKWVLTHFHHPFWSEEVLTYDSPWLDNLIVILQDKLSVLQMVDLH